MKKVFLGIAVLCLATVLMVVGSASAFATEYIRDVVAEDFSSSGDCVFLPPGDVDMDGRLSGLDLEGLRTNLLSESVYSIYSDANGDDSVNIKDLVRQKMGIAYSSFVSGGSMNLNGRSVCYTENLSKFGTGASYRVSYTYTAETPLNVQIDGITGVSSYVDSASAVSTTVTHDFVTPLTIANKSDITLYITGTGVISNFSVTRLNMDNDLEENW